MKGNGAILLALALFWSALACAVTPERLPEFIAWAEARGGVTSTEVVGTVVRVYAHRRLMNADLDTKRTVLKAYFDARIATIPALTSAALIDASTGATVLSYSAQSGFGS